MIETSGHLPECTFADNQQPFESYSLYDCICDRLLACEKRVLKETLTLITNTIKDTK